MAQDPPRRAQAARRIWLAAVALVVLAGVFIPYGPMAGSPGVGVFWLVFGAAVIALIAIGIARWTDAH